MGGYLKTFGRIYLLISLLAFGLTVLLRLNSFTPMSLTSIAIGVLLMVGGRIAENGSASSPRPIQPTRPSVQPFALAWRQQLERWLSDLMLLIAKSSSRRS